MREPAGVKERLVVGAMIAVVILVVWGVKKLIELIF